MFIKTWINILFLLAAAWGSYNIITGKLYASGTWQYYFCLISPWILLFGSLRAWHRCYTWRRMSAAKYISPVLSRGKHLQERAKQSTGILEYACFVLFLTAALAILKQLGIAGAAWWIVLFLITFFMLRLIARRIS